MTAQKKAKAKAPAKATKAAKAGPLEVGLRFAGQVTQQHAKALKAELEKIAPEMVDRINQAQRTPLDNASTFQRFSSSKSKA